MFTSLFSSKTQEVANKKTAASSMTISRMKSFASKVSMILGLTAASNVAISGPSTPIVPDYTQEISTVVAKPVGHASQITSNAVILPPKPPVLQAEKVGQIEPVSVKSKLRIATAQKGESVGIFMLRNFETQEGWQLLVEKETGNRVRVATRDLIAGKTYVLARTEEEAKTLAGIFKKQTVKKSPISKNIKKEKVARPKVDEVKVVPETKESSFVDSVIKKVEELGFDFNRYLHSISAVESKHTYKIDNGAKGKELKVHSSKWAFGRYQFTNETLQSYGVTTPEQRLQFLKNPKQQERIMKIHTVGNMKHIVNEPVFLPLIKAGVQPNHILSAMHHMGAGGVMKIAKKSVDSKDPSVAFFQKLKSSSDWLNTSTYTYVQATALNYDSLAGKIPEAPENEKQRMMPVHTSLDQSESKTMVTTVSANDARFSEKKPETPLVLASAEGLQTPKEKIVDVVKAETAPIQPKTIELKPVGEVKNVVQSLLNGVKEEHKIQIETELKARLMDRARNGLNLGNEERKDLLSKLEKVTDLYAYYQNNIANQEMLKRNGSAKEKSEATRILPGLYKLLSELESKLIVAENDSNIPLKRAA